MCVRVASSRRDARGIRDVLHSAWRVGEDEDYFYKTFNDPEALYQAFIASSLSCDDLRSLDVLCLIGEQADGRIVATFSLVLDHDRRTIELGRGAVAKDCQSQAIPKRFIPTIQRIVAPLGDYSVVADVTTLARGATRFALALASQPVALHPSSFVIQPSCVDTWLDQLHIKHGDTARSLLWRSDTSGLGRFTTAWHISSVTADRPAFRPCITGLQRPFFDYTCDILNAQPGTVDQPATADPERVADNTGTRTRTIVNPTPHRDPQRMLDSAAREGFETVIVQVPCDRQNQLFCRRLETAGALLSGVFPAPTGLWYASYTLLIGAAHRQEVIDNLARVSERDAFDPAYHRLLDLVLAPAAAPARDGHAETSPSARLEAAEPAA